MLHDKFYQKSFYQCILKNSFPKNVIKIPPKCPWHYFPVKKVNEWSESLPSTNSYWIAGIETKDLAIQSIKNYRSVQSINYRGVNTMGHFTWRAGFRNFFLEKKYAVNHIISGSNRLHMKTNDAIKYKTQSGALFEEFTWK